MANPVIIPIISCEVCEESNNLTNLPVKPKQHIRGMLGDFRSLEFGVWSSEFGVRLPFLSRLMGRMGGVWSSDLLVCLLLVVVSWVCLWKFSTLGWEFSLVSFLSEFLGWFCLS